MKCRFLMLMLFLATQCGVVSAQQFYIGVGSSAITGDLILIDAADCSMQTVGASSYSYTGLAFDNEGNLFASESTDFSSVSRLLRIDRNTGAAVVVGDITGINGDNMGVPDITFSGSTLYAWTENTDDLIEVDPQTGQELNLITSTQDSFGTGLAVNSAGTLHLGPAGDDFYTLDSVTGATTLLFTATDLSTNVGFPNGMAFDGDDTLWANVKDFGEKAIGSLVRFDDNAGNYTVVCTGLPAGTDSLAYYGASDLIHKDGFGVLPIITR